MVPRSAGLLFLPALLAAQAPAPLPLGPRLRAEGPEIQALLAEGRATEAWSRAQGLVPEALPVFDPANAWESYVRGRELAQACSLASDVALEAGQWEKALALRRQAAEAARMNLAGATPAFEAGMASWKATAEKKRALIKDSEGRLAELRAKANLEPAERQELQLAAGLEADARQAERNAEILAGALENARRDAVFHGPRPDEVQALLTEQARQQVESPAKGDREAWVEAAISSPDLAATYPGKRDRLFLLRRMSVLAPANPKVQAEIDRLMGKAPTPEPVSKPVTAPKPPKKSGKNRK